MALDNSETIEKAHQTNIERLIDEFGVNRREEIVRFYETARNRDEQDARIMDYLPIFVYRTVRSILTEKRVDIKPVPAPLKG